MGQLTTLAAQPLLNNVIVVESEYDDSSSSHARQIKLIPFANAVGLLTHSFFSLSLERKVVERDIYIMITCNYAEGEG